MLVKDYASVEAGIDKGDPPRLLIEIALRPAFFAGPVAACDPGEVQRAVREGFREVLSQFELERLARTTKPPKSRARRWLGRAFAFTLCAAIGSVTTLLLSASHTAPQYAVESFAPPPPGQAAPSIEASSPYSQSTGAPATSRAAPAAPPTGPATFGLHEQ
ncbi:hypothetical protein DFR50_13526 [Roseiarcus fermentans]|uniref:Uncharacterized protein n=1 Tax=Roseiarcus fermentans TaxID=1473586 RepID=A0A366ETJ3_9HYPH|nr:hypothetical protein [Roseiarcus fermentans]RBP05236.1 hypothetical protein DFR50_13526 [Roseiarcus fermentans]